MDRLQKISTAGCSAESATEISEEIRLEIAIINPIREMMKSLAGGSFDVAQHGYGLASMICQGADREAQLLKEQACIGL
ncbi:hypothetical protein ABH915_002798 [Arthrobacter sp. MW3 TE3886]